MSHAASPPPGTRWKRWLLAGLIVSTLIFGVWGNWKYEQAHNHEHSPDAFSVGYHALQFLLLHGAHLHDPIPWQLHLGRWLGAAFLFTLGVLAFAQFFREEVLLCWLRLPWQRGHVVICGLGDLGMRLAVDARRLGKFVVAIEKQKNAAGTELLREHGILVIEGDACDPATLNRAGLGRSESLFVACADDATNAAIAARAGSLIPQSSRPKSPLICRLLVRDSKMRQLLAQRQVFEWGASAAGPTPDYRVHFHDLDLHDTAARQALRQFPLDFEPIRASDKTRVHVVIVGFGPMGEAMALQVARIGQFANGTPSRKTRITVVDIDATTRVAEFRKRYRKFNEVCELNVHDLDPVSSSFTADFGLLLQPGAANELQTIILCKESATTVNDRENLRLGLELVSLTDQGRRQLLTYQSTRNGYAALLPTTAIATSRRLHAFGMIEDLHSWSILLHESEDKIARAIHEDYVKHHGGDSWETLPETFKESNRHAADHVPVKLRGLGYHDAPLQPGVPRIEKFSDPEKLLMAKMEHERWCTERWLDGWEYGPETNRKLKISKDLVSWERLLPHEQKKDFEQIEALPKILHQIGRGIYR